MVEHHEPIFFLTEGKILHPDSVTWWYLCSSPGERRILCTVACIWNMVPENANAHFDWCAWSNVCYTAEILYPQILESNSSNNHGCVGWGRNHHQSSSSTSWKGSGTVSTALNLPALFKCSFSNLPKLQKKHEREDFNGDSGKCAGIERVKGNPNHL